MPSHSQAFKHATDSDRYNIGSYPVPKGYDPKEDKGEYMNPAMLAYFWQQLRNEYADLGNKLQIVGQELRAPHKAPESIDESQSRISANASIERENTLRAKRTNIKAVIDEIELNGADSDYGHCAETGEEIGIDRLIAVPWARLSVEAQASLERGSRIYANGINRDS